MILSHTKAGGIGNRAELVRQLRAWLTSRQVPLLTRHRASAIVRGAGGEVIEPQAASPTGTVRLTARKGVIFATGGFIHDPELVLNFQPGPTYGGCAVPTAEGNFVRLGIDNGAMLSNMWSAWRAQAIVDQVADGRSVPRLLWQPAGDSKPDRLERTDRKVAGGSYHTVILVAGAFDSNGGPVIDTRARVSDVHRSRSPGCMAPAIALHIVSFVRPRSGYRDQLQISR